MTKEPIPSGAFAGLSAPKSTLNVGWKIAGIALAIAVVVFVVYQVSKAKKNEQQNDQPNS